MFVHATHNTQTEIKCKLTGQQLEQFPQLGQLWTLITNDPRLQLYIYLYIKVHIFVRVCDLDMTLASLSLKWH